jgi:drug/metabolite transporter (DMT)-like permease
MTPGLWGTVSAISWGTCDFLARFTGRAAGYLNALLGMLLVSSIFLTLWVVLGGDPLVWTRSSLLLLVFAGMCSLVGYIFLYMAFTKGPVSVVAPIAGSYPALVVLIAVILGSRPSALQWAGTVVTLTGVVVVAKGGAQAPADSSVPAAPRRAWDSLLPGRHRVVAAAVVAALAWAFMISATQEVAPVVGNVQTIWLPRVVAFSLLAAILLAQWARGRPRPAVPGRWWPVVAAQAALDVAGYYTLYAATTGPNPEIAVMASSAYYVVTVLLGRIVLKERLARAQVGGIALVLAGVVLLSAH